MLEKMNYQHIVEVISIHQSSWSKNEISRKLGGKYLHLFYANVVSCPHSFAYVYSVGGKVIAYACGFYDYPSFNHSFLRKTFLSTVLIFLRRLMRGKITWVDILNLHYDNRKFRKSRYPKQHLGALALCNEYKGTNEGRRAIMDAMAEVLNELEKKKFSGCGAVCDEKNIPMRKYFMELGFCERDRIPFKGKSVVLYEKEFIAPSKN